MSDLTENIDGVKSLLCLSDDDICLLPKDKNEELYFDLLHHFVVGEDRIWWWEDFKNYTVNINKYENPFLHLNKYIPANTDKVWFMIEDDQFPFYPIYECRPNILSALIGECYPFEYYIISKDKT